MVSGTVLALSIASLLFIWYIAFWRKRRWVNCPPGPRRYPLFGNSLQLDKMQQKTFFKWAQKYGPIMRVDLLWTKAVVISDVKLLREIFAETHFAGRLSTKAVDILGNGRLHGIANTDGPIYEELRRFTMRQLRDFGYGKQTMEESFMVEVNELISGLKKTESQKIPVTNMKERLILGVVNSLWEIVTSNRFSHDDPELLKMAKKGIDTINSVVDNGAILLIMPKLADYFPKWSGYLKHRKSMAQFAAYFLKAIKFHKETYSDDHARDFIDVYLKEAKKTKDANSAFYGQYGEDNLLGLLSDLFFAGSDTTSSSLCWVILCLSKMPEVQKKMHKEIDEVTGNRRLVTLSDRPNMHYTEAVIHESFRYVSLSPLGVFHRAVKDSQFKGYDIPENTLIIANMNYMFHNPEVWGDPENFRPERFLSPDGKTFKKHEGLIPFSVGKRVCPGEPLARDLMFLFLCNIMQRFQIDFDPEGPDNGFEPEITLILLPKAFHVILKDRLEMNS